MLHELKTTFSIPIDSFFNIQKDFDLEDYWNFDKDKYDTTIIKNTRYFYKLEDKGNIDNYMIEDQIDKDIKEFAYDFDTKGKKPLILDINEHFEKNI